MSWILTPTTLFINLAEWFQQITINQVFTASISFVVLVYWLLKARKEYFESQSEKRKLELLDE